jgi:hypothetical protein
MAVSKLDVFTQMITVDPGDAWIRINCAIEQDTIIISTGAEPGTLWSGLAFPAYDANYPLSPAPTFWAGKWSPPNVWSFNTFCPAGVTIGTAPDAYKPVRTLELAQNNTVPYALTGLAGDPPFTCLPGLYSGRMRRVVQHMLGAGQVPSWSSRWDNCAWLFTASDRAEWVINVARDTGVRAAPLTYLDVPSRACSGMPWKIAQGHGEWRTLLSATGMAAYFSTREISFDIGFAANDRGTEARNLSRLFGGGSPDPTGVTHVYEWLIQVSEAQDDQGNPYPNAATLTQVSDSIAWESMSGRIHVPLGPFYSEPWDVLSIGPDVRVPKPDGTDFFSWPVHVYYDGDTVKRTTANYNHATPPEERTPPDPKGATDADVWKADGFDPYPYTGSFPKSGTGTFRLGTDKIYYPKLTFEGDGMPEDAGNSWHFSDAGTDVFALEQVGDASGKLVSMGNSTGNGMLSGGPIYRAVRYRTQLQTGESQGHIYAVWIPYGDREAILSLEYHVHGGPSYSATHSVRHSHMFGSGPAVVPGNSGDGRPCCPSEADGFIIQKEDGSTVAFGSLPATCDAASTYSSSWHNPAGTCPLAWYTRPYLCSVSDFLGFLPNISQYDVYDGITQEAETTANYVVRFVGSGIGVIELIAENTLLPMPDWLQNAQQSDNSPLRAIRTYTGQGAVQAFPSMAYVTAVGGLSHVYLDFINSHGLLCLWAGEPH